MVVWTVILMTQLALANVICHKLTTRSDSNDNEDTKKGSLVGGTTLKIFCSGLNT